jgi:hypothetical protein
MDKNAIFNYVEYAREELQKLIKQKAFEYGITDKGAQRGINVINGRLLSKEELNERDTLLSTIESKEDSKGFANGYEIVMEEVSYTWFNRFIALRFMEVNGYLPSHTRVFSDENGRFNPQILKEALTLDIYGIDRLKVSEMVQNNQNEELFKYLIILQCNALSKPMPRMFERIENYTELLFPNGLLKKGSIIDRLVSDIDEEDWKDQVQIIGWMYQFYISKKKDEVFASKKTITKNTIGAVTQLFTPDWIVRYMAENSIGRIWLESNPDSPLKSEMKYYVEDAKQEEDVQKKLEEIRYKDVNPEDIKIIEPCCGSGHILVYCFDLLYKMYLEKGYSQRDIATLILKNNLYGLDVDNRAAQLAYFSVIMKARSVDKQYLTRDTVQQPKVYEIIDSQQLINHNYESLLKETRFSEKSIGIARYLVSTYKNGKVIGSLLKVNRYDYKEFIDEIKEKQRSVVPDLTIMDDWNICLPQLRQLAALAIIMSRKYDVMITNPPYLAEDKLDNETKKYLIDCFYDGRHDMYTAFILQSEFFVKPYGLCGMITQHYFMYSQGFKDLRNNHLLNFISLVDHGPRVFPEISGDVVQTASYVFRMFKIGLMGRFFDVRSGKDSEEKQKMFFNQNANKKFYERNSSSFKKYKDSVFAFTASKQIDSMVNSGIYISNYFDAKAGICTGNDPYFVLYWHEIPHLLSNFSEKLEHGYPKYCYFSKGGSGKYYYGNIDYVIKLNDLYDNQKTTKAVRRGDSQVYYKEGISWSQMGGGINKRFSFIDNCTCGTSSPSLYLKKENEKDLLYYCLAFLNSNVSKSIIQILSPTTLSVLSSDVSSLPFVINKDYFDETVILAKQLVLLARYGSSLHEENREFNPHYFSKNDLLINIFCDFEKELNQKRENVVKSKDRLDAIFCEIYELDDVDKFYFDIDSIISTPSTSNFVYSLISYAIGVSFGRYSLDVEGLAYAGGDWNPDLYSTIIPDDNNIIPILDDGYYPDDAMNKVIEFLTKVYGKDTLDENLKFIADALGGNGTSKEVIRNYLINGFYANHLKIYRKRPIYWLFDAGKQNSFKALIYMHRYTPDLLAKMRTDYILPLMDKYSSRIAYLEKEIPTLTGTLATKSRKELDKVRAQLKELSEYEPKIHHLADERISIDLDDGVKHNYELFKDVLAPLK